MKENLRKPVLFAVIVIIGSVLVLVDIPLVMLVPLILLVGLGTLLAVGSITIAEIRDGIARLGKTGILRRLNDIKFFEGKAPETKKVPAPVPEKTKVQQDGKKKGEATPGFASHITSFFSSIRSLGSVLRQRSTRGKQVEEINKLLDKTVSEKVPSQPPAGAPPAPAAGAGAASPKTARDSADPFLTLSGDEFDEGLLDGLGDDTGLVTPPAPEGEAVFDPADFPDLEVDSPDIPPPTPAISPVTGDILKDAGEVDGGGLDKFAGLDGGEPSDADFGDLDNLSLDDISLDADAGDKPHAAPGAPAAPVPATPPTAPETDSNTVKTVWIPSDAPKGANEFGDEASTKADMAAFAGGSGGDEDLLSSIASAAKHVAKEQDLSLLRELRDFRAPATEIENELGGMYERMNRAQQTKRKNPPDTKRK